MANFRTEVKTLFADWVNAAIGIEAFQGYNNQKIKYLEQEANLNLATFFRFSEIGDGRNYAMSINNRNALALPVTVTLSICFKDESDITQDVGYDLVNKVSQYISGRRDVIMRTKAIKSGEREDIDYETMYLYEIDFSFEVFDVAEVDPEQALIDANDSDQLEPVVNCTIEKS